jgi:hypothetical protein
LDGWHYANGPDDRRTADRHIVMTENRDKTGQSPPPLV